MSYGYVRSTRGGGRLLSSNLKGFTLAEGATHVAMLADIRRYAFTLAEVLVTLGIIGVVAAMTMPVLIGNYQKKVLNDQFKKSYSLVQQAWRKAEVSLGYTPECFYWEKSPYTVVCLERDRFGNCSKSQLSDGSPVPSDVNGIYNECATFMEQIVKELDVIKTCRGNGVADKCIPPYEGYDTINSQNYDNLTDEDLETLSKGCSYWRKTEIHNNRTIYVLKDGTILFPYSGPQLFAIDINGMKGPNKWGVDVFSFQTKAPSANSRLSIKPGGCMTPEKGGVSTAQKLIDIYK